MAFRSAMVALLLAPVAATQSPPVVAAAAAPGLLAADERCPNGRWYTQGGNAAHNGSSGNRPFVLRPEIAWRVPLAEAPIGEPLVWDDYIVLGLRPNAKRSAVEVRRLVDGSVVGRRELNSDTAPVPSLWGNEIVWRFGPDGLERVSFDDKSVQMLRKMPKAGVVGPPLRYGHAVFAVVGGHLVRMRATDFRVQWRSEQAGYAGTVSLANGTVYALREVVVKGYAPVAHDAETGSVRATGATLPLAAPPDDHTRLAVAGPTLVVSFGGDDESRPFGKRYAANACAFRLPLGAADPLLRLNPSEGALDGSIEITAIGSGTATQLGLFELAKDSGIRLDRCAAHRELAKVSPTLLPDMFFFGACAVDRLGLKVLWRVSGPVERPLPKSRAIPAGRSLLLWGGGELVALRATVPADPLAAELHELADATARTRLVALTDEALKTGDMELSGELLDRAREANAAEAWAARCDTELDKQSRQKGRKVDAAKVDAVRTALAAVPAEAVAAVHATVEGWGGVRSAAEVRRGMRFLLERAPGHAPTVARVRALVQQSAPGMPVPEPFRAEAWIDFLDAASNTRVELLEADLAEFRQGGLDPLLAQQKQQLLEWRAKWRRDLQALRSERLLVFSAVTEPGSMAKALATGEIVCKALEEMFRGLPVVRQDPRPMLMFIYPDRDDYLRESAKLGVEAEWTAGYYSDSLDETIPKSRLYVPTDDVGFAAVLPTLAHELTHQWLQDRCPAFRPEPIAARLAFPAFWIVEGFASLIEQFEFDVVQQTFAFGRGNLERADLIASARERLLIDWDAFVAMRHMEASRMFVNNRAVDVASTMHMGQSFEVRLRDLFYAQGAMLCRYLYDAEDGRHRRQLLDYVAAYYRGDGKALDFEQAFGEKASAFGPKVVAYAKELVR